MVIPTSASSTLLVVVAGLVVLLVIAEAITLTLLVRLRRSVRSAAEVPVSADTVEAATDVIVVEAEKVAEPVEVTHETVDEDAQLIRLEQLSRMIADHRAEVEMPGAPVSETLEADDAADALLGDEDHEGVSKRTDRLPPPVLSKREVPIEELQPVPHAWERDEDLAAYGDSAHVEVSPLQHAAPPPRLPLTAPSPAAHPVVPPSTAPRRGDGHPAAQAEFASIEEMAVSAVIDGGRPVPQVAQTLRVSTSLVAYWVAKSGRGRVR